MSNKLTSRPKPELPNNLQLFQIFYNKLKTPLGPIYMGNCQFELDRLDRNTVADIKADQLHFTVIEQTENLIGMGIAVRAETISQFYTDPEAKWWTVVKSDYTTSFEKKYKVGPPKELYRPFIVWAIENGYEFYQIAAILGRTPSTIRQWANCYGYKEFTRITTRSIVGGTKTDRSNKVDEEGNTLEVGKDISVDNSTHSAKIRNMNLKQGSFDFKDTKTYDPSMSATDQEDLEVGACIRKLIERGYNVTVTPQILQEFKLVNS